MGSCQSPSIPTSGYPSVTCVNVPSATYITFKIPFITKMLKPSKKWTRYSLICLFLLRQGDENKIDSESCERINHFRIFLKFIILNLQKRKPAVISRYKWSNSTSVFTVHSWGNRSNRFFKELSNDFVATTTGLLLCSRNDARWGCERPPSRLYISVAWWTLKSVFDGLLTRHLQFP